MVGPNLKPGTRVRFAGVAIDDYGPGVPAFFAGTITREAPEHGGYLVKPDGGNQIGGFGYSELELEPEPEPEKYRPTCWERLVGPSSG